MVLEIKRFYHSTAFLCWIEIWWLWRSFEYTEPIVVVLLCDEPGMTCALGYGELSWYKWPFENDCVKWMHMGSSTGI